ncbi:MAG: transposase, partial [Planctomycetota bacterium]|nr:transposase [Planctomycetota bacterium]
ERTLVVLRDALSAGADRFGFRLVEYSIQTNHLHLIAEAEDERSIARGMQGLLVRVAKALNRAWERRGKVLCDRYHARILRTPRDVRTALVYVLQNARKHGARLIGVDACSSGPWFDGWRDRVARAPRPIAEARSWLLTAGWRRGGLLGTREAPAVPPAGERTRRGVPSPTSLLGIGRIARTSRSLVTADAALLA